MGDGLKAKIERIIFLKTQALPLTRYQCNIRLPVVCVASVERFYFYFDSNDDVNDDVLGCM